MYNFQAANYRDSYISEELTLDIKMNLKNAMQIKKNINKDLG